MSRYLVTGPHAYREHKPGDIFEAALGIDVEERAVTLGAIQLLERSVPAIQPGSYRLPDGWAQPRKEQ